MKLITPIFKKPYIELETEQEEELFKLDKDKEIERLNKDLKDACEVIERLKEDKKKAIEYIEEKYDYILKDDTFLDHDERIDRKQVLSLLDILKGVDKE